MNGWPPPRRLTSSIRATGCRHRALGGRRADPWPTRRTGALLPARRPRRSAREPSRAAFVDLERRPALGEGGLHHSGNSPNTASLWARDSNVLCGVFLPRGGSPRHVTLLVHDVGSRGRRTHAWHALERRQVRDMDHGIALGWTDLPQAWPSKASVWNNDTGTPEVGAPAPGEKCRSPRQCAIWRSELLL